MHQAVADLEFCKEGFQYAIKAHVGCLLGGGELGACPPGKILISNLIGIHPKKVLAYSIVTIPGCFVYWS